MRAEKKRKEKFKRNSRTSQNIRIINAFLESLLSGSFPLLGVTVHLTFLGCPPTMLVSGPVVGATQILIWPYSCVSLPPMSTAIGTSVFSSVGALNVLLYICRHRDCLVDHVDLICSFYSWWKVFGFSSLISLPLGFNCGFISISACGLSTGVCS